MTADSRLVPPNPEKVKEITLVRHGETAANAEGVWEGRGDSPLTSRGREQVKRLARRVAKEDFDLAVTSDLGRARDTADEIGLTFTVDPDWREGDLGVWERMTRREIAERYPNEIAALLRGEDVPFGGGERGSDIARRVGAAFDRVVADLDEGGRGLVVTHGGALLALLGRVLGWRRGVGWPLAGVVNAAVTRIRVWEGHPQVAIFNDSSHLDGDHPGFGRDLTTVVIIRHGETVANVAGRWAGRTNSPLTDRGKEQARLLAAAAPPLDALYASPLQRARDTARWLGETQRLEVGIEEGFTEFHFGSWENLTSEEIASADPDGWQSFRFDGRDVARGGSGETFPLVRERFGAAVDRLVDHHRGGTIGVVSHGGALRAYVTGLLDVGFADRARLASPANTSIGRVVFGERGARVAEYNVTGHLAG